MDDGMAFDPARPIDGQGLVEIRFGFSEIIRVLADRDGIINETVSVFLVLRSEEGTAQFQRAGLVVPGLVKFVQPPVGIADRGMQCRLDLRLVRQLACQRAGEIVEELTDRIV